MDAEFYIKIGRKRGADVVGISWGPAVAPTFEARVDRYVALRMVEELCGAYEKVSENVYRFSCERTNYEKLVVALGVRQFIDGGRAPELLDAVKALSLIESIFWYSRFVEAYNYGSRRDIRRVAKAFRILYRV